MARRQMINVPKMAEGRRRPGSAAPIPDGTRIGNIVVSSLMPGRDFETGEMPADADGQAEALFKNIRKFMELAGGSTDDIALMNIYLKSEEHRDAINKEWLKMFPDENNRPSRNVLYREYTGNLVFEISLLAVLP